MQAGKRASKTKGVWAYGRYDDQPMSLDEGENLLLTEIRQYFMLQWSRHYKKFDEHKLMNRLQYQISGQLRRGRLDASLNLCHFVNPYVFLNNYPIPTTVMESHLVEVAVWLQEKMTQPGRTRHKDHLKRIREDVEATTEEPFATSTPEGVNYD